jgi:hypothetical protein
MMEQQRKGDSGAAVRGNEASKRNKRKKKKR